MCALILSEVEGRAPPYNFAKQSASRASQVLLTRKKPLQPCGGCSPIGDASCDIGGSKKIAEHEAGPAP